MYTCLPNWGPEADLKIGDTGYFTLEYYKAGEQYYDRNTETMKPIRFTNVYFKDFIIDKNTSEQIIL